MTKTVVVGEVITVVAGDGVKHAITETVTSRGAAPSEVVNVIVIVLFSGSGWNVVGVAVVEPTGDVNVRMTSPFGRVTVTVTELTFVLSLGTEAEARTGVMPAMTGMITEASFVRKSTPGEPGVRSDGDVPCGAPVRMGVPRYCGLSMPAGVGGGE